MGRDGAGGDEVVGWDGGEAVGCVVGGEGEVEGEEEGGDGGAVAGETGEDCGVYWRDWLVFSSCRGRRRRRRKRTYQDPQGIVR